MGAGERRSVVPQVLLEKEFEKTLRWKGMSKHFPKDAVLRTPPGLASPSRDLCRVLVACGAQIWQSMTLLGRVEDVYC